MVTAASTRLAAAAAAAAAAACWPGNTWAYTSSVNDVEGVAEALRNNLHVHASCEQVRGVTVSQVVETDTRRLAAVDGVDRFVGHPILVAFQGREARDGSFSEVPRGVPA